MSYMTKGVIEVDEFGLLSISNANIFGSGELSGIVVRQTDRVNVSEVRFFYTRKSLSERYADFKSRLMAANDNQPGRVAA